MNKGDIVLVPFPFTNLEGSKNRPAIVLYSDEFDIVAVFITTKLKWKNSNDILLEPSESNRLKTPSLIRISKIATLDKSIIIGRIGNLDKQSLQLIDDKLKQIFNIS